MQPNPGLFSVTARLYNLREKTQPLETRSHLEEIDAVFGGAKNLGGTPKNAILKTKRLN